MSWTHASTLTHHMTTAKTTPHPWSRFLNLFGGKEFASFQFHLNGLILHLILKVSQFLLFIHDGLGVSVGIGPERLKLHSLGYKRSPELSCLLVKLSTEFLKLCLLLWGQIGKFPWVPSFLTAFAFPSRTLTRGTPRALGIHISYTKD